MWTRLTINKNYDEQDGTTPRKALFTGRYISHKQQVRKYFGDRDSFLALDLNTDVDLFHKLTSFLGLEKTGCASIPMVNVGLPRIKIAVLLLLKSGNYLRNLAKTPSKGYKQTLPTILQRVLRCSSDTAMTILCFPASLYGTKLTRRLP